MAIYHVHFSSVSRSKGHKASAAAAYRAGEKLKDEKYGVTHDYSRKGGVLSSGIMTPNDAPEWAKNRQQLWNEVEKSEKRSDAQLAREIEIALPRELEKKQQEELLNGYIKDNFVQRGMIADWAIHETKSRDGKTNPHAHILLTMRPIEANGFSAKKDRSWNDKDLSFEWRKSWADHANNALEKAGVKEKIDHRSLVDQKEEALEKGDEKKANELDRAPTVKEGKAATALRQKGLASERVSLNEQIKQDNERVAVLKEQLAKLQGLVEKNQEFASKEKVNLDKIREKASDNYNKARTHRDETFFKHGSKLNSWENRGIKQRINDWIRGNSPVGMIKDWAMDKGLIRWDSYHTRRVNYERAKEAINKAEGWVKRSEEKIEKVFFDEEYKAKIEKLNKSIDQAKEKQEQWKGDLQKKEVELKERLIQLQKNQEKQSGLDQKETNSHQSEKLSKLYEKQQQQQEAKIEKHNEGKAESIKSDQQSEKLNKLYEKQQQQRQFQEGHKSPSSREETENNQDNNKSAINKQNVHTAEPNKKINQPQQDNLKKSPESSDKSLDKNTKDNFKQPNQPNQQEAEAVKQQGKQQQRDNSNKLQDSQGNKLKNGEKPAATHQADKQKQTEKPQQQEAKAGIEQKEQTKGKEEAGEKAKIDQSNKSQKEPGNQTEKLGKQENMQEQSKEKANTADDKRLQAEVSQKGDYKKEQQEVKAEKSNKEKEGEVEKNQQSEKLKKLYEKQQQQDQQQQQEQEKKRKRSMER